MQCIYKIQKKNSNKMERAAEGIDKYKKKKGTNGIYGKLYETKLLSFILFKLKTDEEIKDFYLGTNLADIGVFDDICFKFKMKNKWVAAFIQAKHRENLKNKETITDALLIKAKSDYNILECFNSYLKIQHQFKNKQNENKLFADFEDTDERCFIIYTPEADNINTETKKESLHSDRNEYQNKIRDLVPTKVGEHNIFQIKYKNDILTSFIKQTIEKIKKDQESRKKNNTETENSNNFTVNTELNEKKEIKIENFDDFIVNSVFNEKKEIKIDFIVNTELNEEFEKFLNCLFFYTKEAQQQGVEELLIKELHKNYQAGNNNEPKLCDVEPGALMLKLHDKIQKWWMREGNVPYLTKSCDFVEKSKSEVIKTPYLTNLNYTCRNELKKYAIEFCDEAIVILQSKLQLNITNKSVIFICTNAMELTSIKLVQSLRTEIMFIDLKFVTSQNILLKEINSAELDVLVILYKPQENAYTENLFKIIGQFTKKVIVVTEQSPHITLNPNYNVINDENNNLVDLCNKTQNMILESNKITVQGQEGVLLSNLIDEQWKKLIRPEILLMLLKNESISIGKPLCDDKYLSMKNYYIPRHLKENESSYEIKDLKDIRSSFVVIAAEPGMGKSTLITHLSLETKKKYPNCWIVRINLFDHCPEFLQWQDRERKEKKAIDLKDAMTLVCNAELEHFERTKNTTTQRRFDLEVTTDGKLCLKNCENISNTEVIIGPSLLLLELIIYSYNKGSIIFIFDGFDEICPHYKYLTAKFIKILTGGTYQKVWITSRSYKPTIKPLESVFNETSLYLEPLNGKEQETFYEKYFSDHMKLESISAEEFENIEGFFKFMSQIYKKKQKNDIDIMPFHYLFAAAVDHFHKAVRKAPLDVDKEKFLKEWVLKEEVHSCLPLKLLPKFFGFLRDHQYIIRLTGDPLFMHTAAKYFVKAIKDTAQQEAHIKWAPYEIFLETNFKMRPEEKNRRIAYSPEAWIAFQQYKKEAREIYKKLAFLAVRETLYSCAPHFCLYRRIFTDYELKMMRNASRDVKKSGVMYFSNVTIIDGKLQVMEWTGPVFVHKFYEEYFAFEYIVDILKRPANDLKMKIMIHFLLHFIITGEATNGLTEKTYYKLEHDDELRKALSDNKRKEYIFRLLSKQANKHLTNSSETYSSPLAFVVSRKHNYIAMFLLRCVESNLKDENSLTKFVEILQHAYVPNLQRHKSNIFYSALKVDEYKVIEYILDMLKIMNSTLVTEVLSRYENLPKCIRSKELLECSNEQILSKLKNQYRDALMDYPAPEMNPSAVVPIQKFYTFDERMRFGGRSSNT